MLRKGASRKCKGCDSSCLDLVLSLGAMPPVNAFLAKDALVHEKSFPLDLYFCGSCSLLQLGAVIPPEQLFCHYLHMSSASAANRRHLASVADLTVFQLDLNQTSRILEIGSNDGTLLKMIAPRVGRVVGFDPAANLACPASAGIETIVDFFDEPSAIALSKSHGPFDGIIALNVVAHTPDFLSLLRGVRTLLKPGAKFFMENAYVVDTILQGQFDTIYHEHVHNFSLHALCAAYERAGLTALEAEIIPTQGTSIRVIVGRSDDNHTAEESIRTLLTRERDLGLTRSEGFKGVAKKVETFRREVRRWFEAHRGLSVVAVGAPARGVVMLNYCGLSSRDISYVVDDTPLKQGLLTPGSHIEVSPWERLEREPSELFILLSWNYRDELLERLRRIAPSAKVLIPFPILSEIDL